MYRFEPFTWFQGKLLYEHLLPSEGLTYKQIWTGIPRQKDEFEWPQLWPGLVEESLQNVQPRLVFYPSETSYWTGILLVLFQSSTTFLHHLSTKYIYIYTDTYNHWPIPRHPPGFTKFSRKPMSGQEGELGDLWQLALWCYPRWGLMVRVSYTNTNGRSSHNL